MVSCSQGTQSANRVSITDHCSYLVDLVVCNRLPADQDVWRKEKITLSQCSLQIWFFSK